MKPVILLLIVFFSSQEPIIKYRAREFLYKKSSTGKFSDPIKCDYLIVFSKKRITIYSPKIQNMDIISEVHFPNENDPTKSTTLFNSVDSDGKMCEVYVSFENLEANGISVYYEETDFTYMFLIGKV